MEKKWQITVTEKNDRILFERTNEGCFSEIEILGLLDVIREDVWRQIRGEKRPEIKHKCKVVLNDDEQVKDEEIKKEIIEHLRQDIELEQILSKERGSEWIDWLKRQSSVR